MRWTQRSVIHLERVPLHSPPALAPQYATKAASFGNIALPVSRRGGTLVDISIAAVSVAGVQPAIDGAGPHQPYIVVQFTPFSSNNDDTGEIVHYNRDANVYTGNVAGFPVLLNGAPFAHVDFDILDRPYFNPPSTHTTVNSFNVKVSGPRGAVPLIASLTLTLVITYDSDAGGRDVSSAAAAANLAANRGEADVLGRIAQMSRITRGPLWL